MNLQSTMFADLFDTKECARCGASKPRSDFNKCSARLDGLQGYCRECQREKHQAYYDADPAGQIARVREYERTHPEQVTAFRRRYGPAYFQRNKAQMMAAAKRRDQEHPEQAKARYSAYYARTKQEKIASAAEYARDHPDRVRRYKNKWQKSNPLKRLEMKHRRRARQLAALVEPVDFKAIYHRDKGICHICLNPVPRDRLHYDHVIPLAKGGAHSMNNIKVSHARCNLRKGART